MVEWPVALRRRGLLLLVRGFISQYRVYVERPSCL
jgi:hypothetical protein